MSIKNPYGAIPNRNRRLLKLEPGEVLVTLKDGRQMKWYTWDLVLYIEVFKGDIKNAGYKRSTPLLPRTKDRDIDNAVQVNENLIATLLNRYRQVETRIHLNLFEIVAQIDEIIYGYVPEMKHPTVRYLISSLRAFFPLPEDFFDNMDFIPQEEQNGRL